MSTALEIGSVHGEWEVMHLRSDGLYRVRCMTCGSMTQRGRSTVIAAPGCRACGDWATRRKPKSERVKLRRAEAGVPAIDFEVRTDDDPLALALIEARGAMRLEDIGAAMGVTRQRVEQIEKRARMQLAAGLAAAGCTEEDVREWLMRRPVEHALEGGSPDGGWCGADSDRPRIRDAVDREGYDAPGRSWERGMDRAGRPERIAAVGFESEVGVALERALAHLEVEAEMATLAASWAEEIAAE